jgi:hypothetical protein
MNELEVKISNVLRELEENIKKNNKEQIEINRKLLDKLLLEYLKK